MATDGVNGAEHRDRHFARCHAGNERDDRLPRKTDGRENGREEFAELSREAVMDGILKRDDSVLFKEFIFDEAAAKLANSVPKNDLHDDTKEEKNEGAVSDKTDETQAE